MNQHGVSGPSIVLVRLIRNHSAKPMDDDNLAASMKHVQDGISDAIGRDDGLISWIYDQRKAARADFGIQVELQMGA